ELTEHKAVSQKASLQILS
ncbi:nef attachable domain protein, partial [Chlamydia psittaci 02DC21]